MKDCSAFSSVCPSSHRRRPIADLLFPVKLNKKSNWIQGAGLGTTPSFIARFSRHPYFRSTLQPSPVSTGSALAIRLRSGRPSFGGGLAALPPRGGRPRCFFASLRTLMKIGRDSRTAENLAFFRKSSEYRPKMNGRERLCGKVDLLFHLHVRR